ncbi:hypothetical protein EYC80_009378 [Monilinia laxa]|uniref:Uncharacterized protein n=1 Tax=Monilinia laxa TaxID=61186 RepID=A0A5N6JXL4_MONLA|nr:hypothetical protein EYC80_009378 [Monilinia laxa]
MKYRLPTVTLEDIEVNLKNIACSESTITIDFPSSKLLAAAQREWKEFSEFLVISSHAGCNIQGARSPYIVSSVEYILNANTAILSVRRLKWSDAYDKMEVRFGMGQYDSSSLRIHGDLRKRRTSTVSVSPLETVAFPPAPSETPIINTSVHDIGYSVPAGFSLGTFSAVLAGLKDTLSIKCVNCSIEGTVEITQGVFTISSSSLTTQKAVNFLENGFFDAVVNGLGAHIEIDTSIAGTFTESFNQSLVTLTLPGFQQTNICPLRIPEIASIGVMWIPTIRGSISVSKTLDFTYGFDVRIPNNSSIRLNIGNLTDSTAHGFNNISVTALPLTSTDPSITLNLSLSLHSELLLGVNILSGTGSISTGAFLDLPTLSVAISQLSSVDQYCNPSNSSSSSSSSSSPLTSPPNLENLHLFPSLINIVPKADIALGLHAQAQLSIPEINFQEEVGTTAMVAEARWALPTVCLSFDGGRRALVSPTVGLSGSGSGSGWWGRFEEIG